MNVIVLQVFVSLMLVASSVLLFALSVKQRDHEHADRLSLFPLDEEPTRPHIPSERAISARHEGAGTAIAKSAQSPEVHP